MKSDIRIWLAVILIAVATAAYIAYTQDDSEPINGVLVSESFIKRW